MNRIVHCYSAACALSVLLAAVPAAAQVSFASAVDLAMKNSPQVKSAQADLAKASAGLSVMRDIYVPSVVVGGGLGTAYGITLGVPTIFTVSAQSLIYSPQQITYIHGARLDLKAARLALAEARDQAAEDAAATYLALNHDQASVAALNQQFGYAVKLVSIIQDRVNAHLDTGLELKKARMNALEMRLESMQMEDDLNAQRAHLARLTGIPESRIVADARTIPDLPPVSEPEEGPAAPEDPGMLAAEASQQANALRAHADAEYTWKPTVSFGAQYGRVSPIENVSQFYNLHGNYNSASVGVDIKFPILDRVRTAAAKQSAASAARGELDLEALKEKAAQGRRDLERSAAELDVKAQVAQLDYGIASDELQSALIALHNPTGGPPLTPEDEQNARIQERQKYLEMLDTRLAAARAEIDYLGQSGQLQRWLESLNPAPPPQK